MQKDNKYTFLLSHSFKSKIYIRKFEISKKVLHTTGFTAFFLTFGFISLGLFGLVDGSAIAGSTTPLSNETALVAPQTVQDQNPEFSSFNYDRPSAGENFSINSGGPASSFQLTMVESDEEHNQIESDLRRIEATTGGAFLPTIWAHLGKINNEFGFRRNPFGGRTYEFHAGMDIDGERGDSVIAAASGTIIKAEWQGGYGNMIEIDHGNGLVTRYAHLSKIEISIGDAVRRGQLIGLVGSTGRSTGPHLHYELRLNDKAINPRRFLPPEPMEIAQLIKK